MSSRTNANEVKQPGASEPPSVRAVGAAWRLSGDGAVTRRLTVLCDLQERVVSVEECEGCERFIERRDAVGTAPGYLLCERREHDPPTMALPGVQSAVREVMERDVLSVTADVPVEVVTPFFSEGRAPLVVVVDEAWRVRGVIEAADLLPREAPHGKARATAGDIARTGVGALPEDVAVASAAVLLSTEGAAALPVVAEGGELVGAITALDVVGWVAWANGAVSHPRFTARAWRELLPHEVAGSRAAERGESLDGAYSR